MRKDVLSLAALATCASAAVAASFTEVEPNDEANQAQNLSTVTHLDTLRANHALVGGGGTFDWFRFTLPDYGGTWTIEALPAFDGPGDGIADTLLVLYSDAGVTEVTFDDDGGMLDPDTGFGLSKLTGIAPGTYYLKNEGYLDDDDPDGVDYILEFESSVPPPPPCPNDTNGDSLVDVTDLLNVVLCWGTSGADCPSPGVTSDTNNDNNVDVADLIQLVLNWGPCP